MLAGALVIVGLAYRLRDFGRYGFWNDEAWVALSTRVVGFAQFRLALGSTPPLWAGTLRLGGALPARPEVSLRLLPLAFGALTLWAAYRYGRQLAGDLGGLLALAVVALDPGSIEWAKVLKQYTAEAFLGVLAFHLASRFVAVARRRDLIALAVALSVGAALGTTQLLLAPPLFAALLGDAIFRRDTRRALAVGAGAATVAAWDVAYFHVAVAPSLTTALGEYWRDAYVPTTPWPAARFVAASLGGMLRENWSGPSLVLGVASLVVLARRSARALPVVAALVLLVGEAATVSALGRLPFGAARVMLFLRTLLHVHLAAAVALVVARLWSRPREWPLAVVVLAVAVHGLVAQRDWTGLGRVPNAEDLGPLVRLAEAERQPGDAVLVYARSVYVYAYYQARTPVLAPAPTTVGFVPVLDDPDVTVVDAGGAPAAAARALASHARVWFLGSRFFVGDEWRIRKALLAHGRLVRETTRPRSVLLLVAR